MTEHTPGPWHIDTISPCTVYTIRQDTKPPMRLELATFWGRTGDEAKVNAELFLNAPETAAERDRLRADKAELLAALKDILQADFLSPEARRDAVRRAGAAIAAAEGKTP